jgi:hypothetical protein
MASPVTVLYAAEMSHAKLELTLGPTVIARVDEGCP